MSLIAMKIASYVRRFPAACFDFWHYGWHLCEFDKEDLSGISIMAQALGPTKKVRVLIQYLFRN